MDFLANMAKRLVQNLLKHSHSYGLRGFGQESKPDSSEIRSDTNYNFLKTTIFSCNMLKNEVFIGIVVSPSCNIQVRFCTTIIQNFSTNC